MLNLLKNDIEILEEFKHQIRSMTPQELDAETILDLLNPIIRHKEKQMVNFAELEDKIKEHQDAYEWEQRCVNKIDSIRKNLLEGLEHAN